MPDPLTDAGLRATRYEVRGETLWALTAAEATGATWVPVAPVRGLFAAIDQGQQEQERRHRDFVAAIERATAAEARLQALQQRVQVLEQKWRSSASRIGALQADVLLDCADGDLTGDRMSDQRELSSVARVLARLHADLHKPEASLEDDGDVGLDWSHARDCVLSIHVSADGHGGWAALVGEYKSHGKFHVPEEWPAELVKAQQAYVARIESGPYKTECG